MFCDQCGAELVDGSKFCTKCGNAVAGAKSDGGSYTNLTRYALTIERQNQWFAINPDIEVIVDGSDRYMLPNGNSMQIMVGPGRHNVAFYCTIRSKIVDITVNSDMKLEVKFNRLTGSIEVREGR